MQKASRYYREIADRSLQLAIHAVGWGIYALAALMVFYLMFSFYIGRLTDLGI